MGFYGERVLPRIFDKICGTAASAPLRRRVCEGLAGDVVEIGFGSGHNVPYYPSAVTRVSAIEPADLAWELAGARVRASQAMVERAGLDGQSLPFADGSYDAALSTYTVCTIPDPIAALREVHRVLRPGGEFHFLEHGLAPDESVRRWQHRIEPAWKHVAGGCHLARPIVELFHEAGFTLRDVDEFYEEKAPKFGAAMTLGVAVAA